MNFVDRIGAIIEDVRFEWNDSTSEQPYYLYGHPKEIFNTLSEKDQNETYKYSKYPLIALFQDFEESVEKDLVTVQNITIVIMTETSPDYKASNRYENTFTPVLIPIYDLLMKHLKWSPFVRSDDFYTHKKHDRLYWGTGDEWGNMLRIGNDALDAIVISGLSLGVIECKNVDNSVFISEDGDYLTTESGNKIITEG